MIDIRICAIMASAVALGLTSSPAEADCTVSSDAGATAVEAPPTNEANAATIIAMSMAPKLLRLDYAAATSKRPACDLGPVLAPTERYELFGEDGAGGRTRVALPARDGAPVAVVMPVIDLLKVAEAAKAHRPAPVSGYLLATVTRTDVVGWRLYSGMPAPSELRTAMSDALAGKLAPIFRNGPGGKTYLSLPKS